MKLEELVGKSITEAQFDEAAGKKDACYHKVKARYDVWPSAYASGALVKCRKAGAKNWGNKSKKEGLGDKFGKTLNKYNKKRKKNMDALKKLKKKKPIRLRSKSGMGKISHLGMESVDERVNPEMKKIYNLLIKYGSSAKDAAAMIKKNLKYVNKAYSNSSPRGKTMALIGLQSMGEGYSIRDIGLSPFFKKLSNHQRQAVSIALVMGGNMTGAVKAIEKIKKGLSKDKKVKNALKMANEGLDDLKALPKNLKKSMKKKRNEARGTCWVGYQQKGMKDKGGKMVPNCVKEITEIFYESDGKGYGYTFEHINDGKLNEAEYQGRKVKLGKIMQGDAKKFKVYVKNPKGNVVKVNFGQGGKAKGGTMKIRKSNPGARKSFRARHNCDSPGPRHKARYWSCRKW